MSLKIVDGAIFIADVHYPNHSKEFIYFLEDILSSKIDTKQLFLMGDIFDLLVGENKFLIEYNSKAIDLINKISQIVDVIYLEGNHDFNICRLFKDVKVFKIEQQPSTFKANGKTISIAHGDISVADFKYKLYSKIIRNRFLLKLIPTSYAKSKLKKLSKKNICKKIDNFKEIAKKIIDKRDSDLIIEGHFHQGVIINSYISLPSFACTLEYGIYRSGTVNFKKYIY